MPVKVCFQRRPRSPARENTAISLAPNGAILKRSAADPKLFEKEGRREEQRPLFKENGGVVVLRRAVLDGPTRFGARIGHLVLDKRAGFTVHDLDDFWMAERLLRELLLARVERQPEKIVGGLWWTQILERYWGVTRASRRRMIPKSGDRFSEQIMRNKRKEAERRKTHPFNGPRIIGSRLRASQTSVRGLRTRSARSPLAFRRSTATLSSRRGRAFRRSLGSHFRERLLRPSANLSRGVVVPPGGARRRPGAWEERSSPARGRRIRSRSLDSQSAGVRRQAELRGSSSDEGFAEPVLWTGIGKARSGCGAALVGSPAEVTEKILQYRELGLSAFIFSGYPHIDEAERFAELVLPNLPHGPLAAG